ncbi:hypothetical protein [Motilimonas cestriensis]
MITARYDRQIDPSQWSKNVRDLALRLVPIYVNKSLTHSWSLNYTIH